MKRSTLQRLANAQYRPLQPKADPSAALTILGAASGFDPQAAAALSVNARAAWQRLKDGAGSGHDWVHLAAVSNICLVRAESIDPQLVELIQQAQAALESMRDRATRLGRWAPDHTSLLAMPDLLDLHDELLRESTPLQMHKASLEAHKRTKNQHAFALQH